MDIDVRKPVENPVCKKLLQEWKEKEGRDRAELTEAIAKEVAENAKFLAIIDLSRSKIRHEDGKAVFEKDSIISFEMLKGRDSTDYMPVFTDWEELRKDKRYAEGHVDALIVDFDDIAAVTGSRAGAVVNPFSHSFVISPENLIHMKKHKEVLERGYSENTVEKDTKVLIGDPVDPPMEMLEAVRKYAKENRDIRSIWLKLMEKEGEKSYLLIVDFDGDRQKIFSGIADAAVPHIRNGLPLDMIPYDDGFGRRASSGEPFYRKKKGLFR